MKKITAFLITLFCIATLFIGTSCSPEDNGPVQYAITMANNGNGMAMASVNGEMVLKAETGATVTITALAAEGYLFDKWVVVSGGVTLIGDVANIQTFTMPANEVSIKAEFKAIPDDIFQVITDPQFKARCQQYNTDGDNKLSYTETQAVTEMDASGFGIESLSGIEYFTSLTLLSCNTNQLTSLDLSKNTALTILYCNDNQLTSLDVSKNTKLTSLECGINQLPSLDVSKNTALTELYCYENQLPSLDVSKNTALTILYCNANQLPSLDVSKNTKLTSLWCHENLLTSLDISNNTKLTYLYCNNNINLTKIFVWSSFDIDNPSSSITNINKDPQAVFERK